MTLSNTEAKHRWYQTDLWKSDGMSPAGKGEVLETESYVYWTVHHIDS